MTRWAVPCVITDIVAEEGRRSYPPNGGASLLKAEEGGIALFRSGDELSREPSCFARFIPFRRGGASPIGGIFQTLGGAY
jgi:hypothetical protein